MKVFFDLDGTLLDDEGAVNLAVESFKELFLDFIIPGFLEEFQSAWRRVLRESYDRYLSGQISFQEQRRERVRRLSKVPLSDKEADLLFDKYLDLYEKNWRAFHDVSECLESLEGDLLGVITNGNGEQQRRKVKDLKLESYLPLVIASEDVGFSKPASEIFLHACTLAGVSPTECCYVGDRRDIDVEAARAAGMYGVWLDRGKEGEVLDIPVIHTLSELPRLLGRQ